MFICSVPASFQVHDNKSLKLRMEVLQQKLEALKPQPAVTHSRTPSPNPPNADKGKAAAIQEKAEKSKAVRGKADHSKADPGKADKGNAADDQGKAGHGKAARGKSKKGKAVRWKVDSEKADPGNADRDTANRDTADRGTADRGTADRDTANRDSADQDTADQGTADQAEANEDSGSPGFVADQGKTYKREPQTKTGAGLKMCKYLYLQAMYGFSINIHTAEILFASSNSGSLGRGHVGSPFIPLPLKKKKKERKKVG